MKTIIWDVDDVLNDLMKEWLEKHWLPLHPECTVRYENLTENPPHNILHISIENYRKSLDEFRSTCGSELRPVSEVYDWFKVNGSNFRHMALTAVPLSLAHISAAWVCKYFGMWIRSFHVVPSPRSTDPHFFYDRSKKEYLVWLKKGDIFVDDNLENISGAEDLGMKTIIIPHPWNKTCGSTYENLQLLNNI